MSRGAGGDAGAVIKSFDGGRRPTVTPGAQPALLVQAGLQYMAGGWPVEIVAEVIFARPDNLHGRAGIARDKRSFDRVVLNQAAAKATADERDVDFDTFARNA